MIGVLVFAFYQYNKEPVFFNQSQIELLSKSKYKDSLVLLNKAYDAAESQRIRNLVATGSGIGKSQQVVPGAPDPQASSLPSPSAVPNAARQTQEQVLALEKEKAGYKATIKRWLNDKEVGGDDNDTNYIFLRFVMDYLPKGLIGLLIAVIFLAAWGSIAATLNSLSSCTIVDFHKRFSKKELSDEKEYRLSQLYTLFWGIFCVAVAQLAYNLGNSLIEAVNVLGSLFYGVILGIFLVAFYRKRVGGVAVFISAVIVEIAVVVLTILSRKGIIHLSFLWFNVVGAIGVVILSEAIQWLRSKFT